MNERSRQAGYGRGGCLTCKERHKKCDEQKPRCKACTRLDLDCKQPDLFRASNLSRSHPHQRVNSTFDSAGRANHVLDLTDAPHTLRETKLVALQRASSIDSGILGAISLPASTLETFLLQHYVERSSSVLLNVDGPANTLRSLVLPRASSSSMLTDAVYATSSRHVCVSNSEAHFRIAALTYYGKASTALQQALASFDCNTPTGDRELALLTSVFLCKYEIVAGGFKNWRPHLRGLHRMLRTFQISGSEISQDVVDYTQSFIAYHWYISGITNVDRANSPTSLEDETDMDMTLPSGQIDPYMGISSNYIASLYAASRMVVCASLDIDVAMRKVREIIQSLEGQEAAFELTGILLWLHETTSSDLSHIADAYRCAINIYLHIVLDRIGSHQLTDADALQAWRLRSLLMCTKDEAISECLRSMNGVSEESPSAVGLAPLLFIVASEASDKAQVTSALSRLRRLWRISCLGNLGTAVNLLETIEQLQPLDWREILASKSWDLIVS